jgi:hypothetical protein
MVETSTITTTALLVITLIVLAFVSYELYQYYEGGGASGGGGGPIPETSYTIIGPYTQGNASKAMTVSDKKFPRSSNQPDGIEFSYAAWMRVRNWMPPSHSGMPPGEGVVFIKGVPGGQGPSCPALTVRGEDGLDNTLNVYIDTFNRESPTEKLSIYNLPAGGDSAPFFHLAIVVENKTAKIYINGLIKKHETLNGIPQQNQSSLNVAPNGLHQSFTGEIGSFAYYNYALSPSQVTNLANTPPTEAPVTASKNLPPYQASSWWF